MRLATLCLLSAVCLGGCGAHSDRTAGPLSAFDSARDALHRHDIAGYIDALGDESVLEILRNASALCLMANGPEAHKLNFPPNRPCREAMIRGGWPAPFKASPSIAEFDNSLNSIADKRKAAVAVEAANRESDVGTSFVWSHLDPIHVKSIKIQGDRAIAMVELYDQRLEMRFARDSTGWRSELPFGESQK